MAGPTKIGVIGCGQISGIYIETARRRSDVELIACADVVPEAVEFRASMDDIPRRYTPAQFLADPDIELVLNLTNPGSHAAVARQILEAGKSVYGEKPLATTLDDAREILALAAQKGLCVGCAPDTFLGAGIQTCQTLIAAGAIGQPVAAVAFFMNHGPEMAALREPQPESPTRQSVSRKPPGFYFTAGIGPMFDMGTYYLTALAVLIGPCRRVTGSARITWPERPLGDPQYKVLVPSHIAGTLDHANGAVSTIMTSTDVWPTDLPRLEIYGETGSLSVPDPNTFAGAGAPAAGWRKGVDRDSAHARQRAEQSRSWAGRDGAGDAGQPPPSREWRACLPHSRNHGRDPRGVPRGAARRADEQLHATETTAGRATRRRARLEPG
jgi:predicted dehydrogenase